MGRAAERRALVTGLALIAAWGLVIGVILWRYPPAGDDAYAHAVFGIEQVRCWRGGTAWPRFHPDWNGGTGSFLPSIYSPIPLTVGGAATLLTGEGTRAVAVSLLLAAIVGALLLRGGVRRHGGPWWLWLALPYVLVNIFSRATVTEMWALAATAGMLPLALPRGPLRAGRGVALTALVAVIAGSQPVMLLVVGVPLAVAWIVSVPPRYRGVWGKGVAWGVASVLATAVFWLPPLLQLDLFDRRSLLGGEYLWKGHFVTSVAGNAELGPVMLAIWIATVMVAVAGVIRLRHDDSRTARAEVVFLAVCVLLACPLTAPLWGISGLGVVQFPWRFLGPASVVSVFLIARFPARLARALGAALLLPALLVPIEVDGGVPRLSPDLTSRSLATACSARYGIVPLLPSTPGEWARDFAPVASLRAVRGQAAKVQVRAESCLRRSYHVILPRPGSVLLPVQWWPEWRVEVDGRPGSFVNRSGLVALALPDGTHTVELTLGPAETRYKAAGVTIAGLLVVALLCLRARRDQRDVTSAGGTSEA